MEHGIRASLNRLARMSLISVVLCAGCADHSSVDELFSSDPLPDGTEIARLAGEADWASFEAVGFIDALLER